MASTTLTPWNPTLVAAKAMGQVSLFVWLPVLYVFASDFDFYRFHLFCFSPEFYFNR
jgi:hypothetical protein